MRAFKNIIFAIVSLGISQFLCYFFVDDVFVNFATAEQPFHCLRLFIAIIIYTSINWTAKNSIKTIEKDILFFSYVLLAVSLSIFRMKLNFAEPMNFNVLDMVTYSKTTIILNILFYIPFGYYAKSRIRLKPIYTFAIFLAYIISIELLQHYLKVGFFDINDIMCNTFGFVVGFVSKKVLENLLCSRKGFAEKIT
ncbi:VanZ family protein [Ruminiclostridium herbifermentans]|uniref:VanZ family protein n=1 Tax=Ruminiclostridium herbifermentans TaxID=2488810 RepID=A0A7H1VMX8_9FIRM|nr:VanZ family protein [Ruminiclostridium herbifermentans]QNU66740.1 VanZ family protein [Ruminiclostridium herbifermentans]